MDTTIWDILGIEETKDKKKIKIAYAKKSKNVHPEEDPEGFQNLYNAYKTALAFATAVRVEVVDIIEPEKYDGYGFDESLARQEWEYEEKIGWIFDKLEYMMSSQKYEDWHDDNLWETIVGAKEFNEYKYTEGFIDAFTLYIINNDKIPDKYLDMIYLAYGFDKENKNTIDDLLYPLYLYLNDRLYGFINIASTCAKRLWYVTGLSIILFLLHSNKLLPMLLFSIAFTSEQLFYQVPQYKERETSSNDIYKEIRFSYINILFQIGIQYTFVVIQFPDLEIMAITIFILTIVFFIFSIIKKYRHPEPTEFYYQLLFLILSVWAFMIGDKNQMWVIAIISNLSLLLVCVRWIISRIKRSVRVNIGALFNVLSIMYITIVIQYILLFVKNTFF